MKSQMDSVSYKGSYQKLRIYMQYLIERAYTMTARDFTIWKVCCLCFGAWIAAIFAKAAKKSKQILLISFLVSWSYLIWRIFFQGSTEKDL